MTIIIRFTLFGFIFAATFFCSLIKAQRQIPSSTNEFFNSFQRPNLQLIQLHAQQQHRPPSSSPLSQIFRTRQQQSFVTRRPVSRISLRRRNLSAERSLRAGISRNKPARIILDPNISNEISDNRFLPQLRTQGNADFSRIAATTLAPQKFAPPRRASPPQRTPPIEVIPSRVSVRPPLLRRPSLPAPPPPSTQSQSLPPRTSSPPQQQRQQIPQRPPGQSSSRSPPQFQQSQQPQQLSSRSRMQQQQQQQRPLQQQPFLRPPMAPASLTPRMPQQSSPQMQQRFQNRPPPIAPPPSPPPIQTSPSPRPQTRPQPALTPPASQSQTFNPPRLLPSIQQQPRSPTIVPPPPPPQQQQIRRRITPDQRFTKPEQARILPPPSAITAPIGPPRPSSQFTTNNIGGGANIPSQLSHIQSPSSPHMPGFLPPNNSVVDELNNSKNFLEVARKLHLRRVTRVIK